MNQSERGERIRRRRLALGISNLREFQDASGRDRETLSKAEKGQASEVVMDWLEDWLDKQEVENGHDGPELESQPAEPPARITFRDIYGVGEIILESPTDDPERLAEMVRGLLAEVRRQRDE